MTCTLHHRVQRVFWDFSFSNIFVFVFLSFNLYVKVHGEMNEFDPLSVYCFVKLI